MRTSDQINEIAAALAKAQGAIEGAVKGKENPHFRSKYADLGAVWDACREHLSKNQIAVVQPLMAMEGDGAIKALIVTRLVHSSGQWFEDGGTPLILNKQDMQGLGSAITYARRYGLMSMVGIAPEDDDGNAAVQQKPKVEVTQIKPAPAMIPEGSVLLKKVTQQETSAGKVYFEIVTDAGEALMTWGEQAGKFAEQACQNGEPVRLQVGRGEFQGMAVIKSLTPAAPPQPIGEQLKASVKELAASDIPFVLLLPLVGLFL